LAAGFCHLVKEEVLLGNKDANERTDLHGYPPAMYSLFPDQAVEEIVNDTKSGDPTRDCIVPMNEQMEKDTCPTTNGYQSMLHRKAQERAPERAYPAGEP
jgi:hypothetical protein